MVFMVWEKRNVVEQKRTPDPELNRKDEHWDKEAANEFKPVKKNEAKSGGKHKVK